MTNKEAIKGLKALSKEFSGYKPNEEMFDMAIKALEGEDKDVPRKGVFCHGCGADMRGESDE